MQNTFYNSTKLLLRWDLSKGQSILGTVPVRYFRKPKWLPMVRSKAYQNVELNSKPVEEFNEVCNFKDNYKAYYSRSLWLWQRKIIEDEQFECDTNKAEGDSEEMQLKRIVYENDVNIRIKFIRDADLVKEWVQVREEILKIRKDKESDDGMRLEAAKKRVFEELERLKTSINLEDLDEAIEKAMSSEVDYNFAIDSDGIVIRGRNNHGLVSSANEPF